MNKFLLIIFLGIAMNLKAQELNCNVIIDYEQIQTQETQVIEVMRQAIWNFMNTRIWTNDDFQIEERITCNLVITLTGGNVNSGQYTANAQIQGSRTIYNTDYESLLLNFVDKNFSFQFQPGQDLQFNENIYQGELSSMLAFYAYMIIGLDYDSFGELSGTPYFEKVRTIVNAASSVTQGQSDGWEENKGPNNRYWLAENVNSPQMTPVRKEMYRYHRLAMDQLTVKPVESQKLILESLQEIQKVRRIVPVSIFIKNFFMCKTNELVNVFTGASQEVKSQSVQILRQVDPTNTENYMKISMH